MLSHTQPLQPVLAIQFNLKFRTKVTISLFEVILSLLQPLHPVLDLQIDLSFLKMITNVQKISEILGLGTQTNFPALFEPIPPLNPQNSSQRQ